MLKKALPLFVVLAFLMILGIGSLLAQDSTEPVTKDTSAIQEKAANDTSAAQEKVAEEPEAPKHDFVGAKKCKICHKAEYDSWLTTKHATAWGALKPEEQKKEECAGCHSTGVTAAGDMLEGVQCESCHGAGNDYRKTKIMKDIKLAMENGLVMPTAEVCTGCHNEKSPNFKGFDFEKYVVNPAGIHVHPEKKKSE